jgi:alkanesulfonate monooxygenase SsuD/methylene tetrahydromethanopterin reductase-like flavin-dependent oxidoreductase (luciferase family)
MQVSYFETGRYYAPSNLPRQWPMPAGAYDREAGLRAFRGMVERSRYVEELGFDWVSVSEHHYSPRILTPSLPIAAAYIASHVHNIKIALLGPIVPQSNPVLLAEEMAMLDTMAEGRLIVGMLRGTTNEMMTYDLNPAESRERCSSRCRRCTPSAPAVRRAISRRATISASACRSARSMRWAR